MKFSKESVEWAIFVAIWKFYQEFYEPQEDEPIEDFLPRLYDAAGTLRESVKGKPQELLMKGLTLAVVDDISFRADQKWREKNERV